MTALLTPDHPELIAGPNPLLESMGRYIPLRSLYAALHREPLPSLNWRTLAPEYREPLLAQQENHFFPTTIAVEVAAAVQSAMRGSLFLRNPCDSREQRRINRIALLRAETEYESEVLQSVCIAANGGLIAAETGSGKSFIVKRCLEVFAPDQIVVHSRSEACGWSRLTQVLYLHLELPSNSSRGGLLSRLMQSLDAAAGTDYSRDLKRCRNLDQQLVHCLKCLSIHRVAMVVLDEGQPDNIEENEWQREYVLFFLAVMNLGVPLILSGHPGAFQTLRSNAQLCRRFSRTGVFDLGRARVDGEAWWEKSLVPGMMRFNLCDEVQDSDAIVKVSRASTGGVPGLFAIRWVEAQKRALVRGKHPARLTLEDYQEAGAARIFVEATRMVSWLEDETPGKSFSDLHRDKPVPGGFTAEHSQGSRAGTTEAGKVLDKVRRQALAAATRKANKLAADKLKVANLDAVDLRNGSHITELLAGFEDFQQSLLTR